MRGRVTSLTVSLVLLGATVFSAQVEEAPSDALVVAAESSERAYRDAGEVFVAANTAYEQGDFAAAVRDYQELIDREVTQGRVYFNLGNAYLRNGELGHAVAGFRRARNLRPRDEDILANLTFARESTRDAIAPPEPSPVLSTLLFWHYRLSLAELAMMAVLLNTVFWALAIVRLFRRESEILSWMLMALLVVLLLTAGSLIGHRFFTQPVAVVVPQEIEAFTAPDTDSVVRFKLHAGTELRVKDEREGWLRIVLPDDQQGWIEAVWAEIVDG